MPAPSKPYTFSNTPTGTNVIDADQVNADFDTLYSLLNKGVDASNTTNAFAKDNVEPAFERYKELVPSRYAQVPGGTSGGVITLGITPERSVGIGAPTAAYLTDLVHLDPADYVAGSRTTKYRVKAQAITNGTGTAVTFTVGLYPIATWGSSGTNATVASLGAVTSGSTVAFASPSANTRTASDSGDFSAPAAGYYLLGCAISGTLATNSGILIRAALEYRQV